MRTLLLFLFATASARAGWLRGHVTDAKGEALPFATVFLQGTTTGTTTNASGDYAFDAPAGTHEVVCRYLGYVQTSKPATVAASDTLVINFSLREEERSKAISEVTVRAGEDPALRIIRKAIAKRQEHLDQVESFQTSTYIKGVLRTRAIPQKLTAIGVSKKDMKEGKEDMGLDSTGKGVIYLVEQQADYYSQKPNKRRTVVRRVRESGDPRGLGLSSVPSVTTLYAENVRLFGGNPRGFVSPIADGAPSFYRYKLLGETVENGRIIYALSVEPKRAYEPLFRGRIYIVNDEYAFHSLDLTATKTSGLESLDTVRLVQTFLPLPSGIWVIKSQQYYPAVKFFGFDIVGHLATVYDNQKVNAPIPDSIFGGKIISSYEKEARNSDTAYWNAVRSMPLEGDEVRDFKVKDSLRIRDEDPARRDSLRRRANHLTPSDILLGGMVRTREDKWTLQWNGLITVPNYNTVEGLNLTLRPQIQHELDSFHLLELRGGLRYGINNERFNAIAALAYRHNARGWAGRGGTFTITGGRFVFQIDPQNPVPPLLNAYATLVEGLNPLKIYERYEGSVRYAWRGGNGFGISGGLSWQRRQPLENTTDFTWQKGSETVFTSNTPVTYAAPVWESHNALLARAAVRYQPGVRYVLQPDRKVPRGSDWPVFEASYTKGIPDILGSRVDYDRWSVSLADEARLRLLGSLEYRLEAGGFLRERYVSLPDLIHFRGNEFTLAAPYLQSFQGMPYYRYSNREPLYAEGHVEYNLQGLLSNKLPLLRQARWNIVTGGNGFYAGDDLRYGEAFLGIDNLGYKLLRFLRVDAVRAWGSLQQPMWLLRVGLKTGGAVRISSGRNADDEW